ncbi:hypothetical protein PENTCL1PPCAC_3222, partial [Pristionchus entomophagus]
MMQSSLECLLQLKKMEPDRQKIVMDRLLPLIASFASVVGDKFAPYVDEVSILALRELNKTKGDFDWALKMIALPLTVIGTSK